MRCALAAAIVLGCTVGDAHADEAAGDAAARQLATALGLDGATDRVDAFIILSRASLDVDATLSRLLHEEYQAKNAHDLIEDRHEDAVARWNIAAVLVGSGVSVAGAGMELGSDTTAKWGNGLVIVGSTVAAAFSIVALVRRDRGPLPAPVDSSLLAPMFGCAPGASRYPDWIWRYLDTPPAGARRSIRADLLDKWSREHRYPPSQSCGSSGRIKLLVEPLRVVRRIDAVVLDDRADMLADLRERLAGVSVGLDRLWRDLQAKH